MQVQPNAESRQLTYGSMYEVAGFDMFIVAKLRSTTNTAPCSCQVCLPSKCFLLLKEKDLARHSYRRGSRALAHNI